MESMELHQVLNIQRIILILSISFTVLTLILIIISIVNAERVKVNISKQVKKEKLTFSNEDITLPGIDRKSDKVEKKADRKEEKHDDLLLGQNYTKTSQKKEKSIFDLKDL